MDSTTALKEEAEAMDSTTEIKPEGGAGDSNGDANVPIEGERNTGTVGKFTKGNEDKKVFVGGISYDTTEEDLLQYFGQFGEVTHVQIKYDHITGHSRGFAFVEFGDVTVCKEVLRGKDRTVKGKQVEVKPAKSRENKKVFVGGLPGDFPEDQLKAHFEQFGTVEDVEWPWDKQRMARRNFAFIVFEDEAAADSAAAEVKQKFGERLCDVKKAVPQPKRFAMGMGGGMGGGMGRGGGGRGGRGGRGGGWGGHGSYGGGAGGWGDWGYGNQGYGNQGYYSGYGAAAGAGYGQGYGTDANSYSQDSYDYWSGWGAGAGGGAGGYDTSGTQGQNAGTGAGGRGRYQPY